MLRSGIYSVIATDGRRRELLNECLAALAQAQIPDSYSGVIIVENSPEPSLQSVVDQPFPFPVTYHALEELNKSAALNLVLSHVDDELLYFIDDDITLAPGALVAMDNALRLHPSGAFFGGPVSVRYETVPPAWLLDSLPKSAKGWSLPEADLSEQHRPVFLGGNWAAKASDLRSVGGFSLELGPSKLTSGEDTLIQQQLLSRGWKGYYVPNAVACHYVPAEKCHHDFAIERAARSSMYQGLMARGRPGEFVRLLFVGLLGACVYGLIHWLSLFGVFLSSQTRFHVKFRLQRKLALLQGLCSRAL